MTHNYFCLLPITSSRRIPVRNCPSLIGLEYITSPSANVFLTWTWTNEPDGSCVGTSKPSPFSETSIIWTGQESGNSGEKERKNPASEVQKRGSLRLSEPVALRGNRRSWAPIRVVVLSKAVHSVQ